MTTSPTAAIAALVLVCAAVFANAIPGDFVYDDTRQIVQNHLIASNARIGEALSRDVWAFKGDRDEPWSNYWRPAFVLWLIANERAFGAESATGWHVANIALHALVCALGFLVLGALGCSRAIAFACALVFAVHPANVESVAWISGSPNMLCAAALFAALIATLSAARDARWWKWAAAFVAYAFALTSKEIAILFPAIVFVALRSARARDAASSASSARAAAPHSSPRLVPPRRAALIALAFAAAALAYVAARAAVLRGFQTAAPWSDGYGAVFTTLPATVLFYLRQIVFPVTLAPSYPLRPIAGDAAGFASVVAPLAAVLAAAALFAALARAHRAALAGAMLCALTLLPALNLRAFLPEQLVHDRYIYLPLFGALATLFAGGAAVIERRLRIAPAKAERACLAVAIAVSIPLAVQTVAYNRVWASELALWTRCAEVDPSSAFNQSQLAMVLRKAGRFDEAKVAIERSLAVMPNQFAMTERAIIALREKRWGDAERDLRWTIENTPAELPAYENLAHCLQQQGRLAEAEEVLRDARAKLSHLGARITANLAVILYQSGRKDAALAELEANRAAAARDAAIDAKRSLFLLGQLYAERGRTPEARGAFEECVAALAGAGGDDAAALRANAAHALAALR